MPSFGTRVGALAVVLATGNTVAAAQAWREDAAQLSGSARVLLVGTRPEDADNALLALLGRGHNVRTAFLSLTRGEAGINVAGSERNAPLGVVRTAEMLAERQQDGARQYVTRAFDPGAVAADSIVERLWPRESLLVDLVSVIRAFRPHAVIALGAPVGEPDATRRYTARLVAEAFTAASDTARFPRRATSFLGGWQPARLFTRVDSVQGSSPVVRADVGAFDRGTGRSFAELGAEIRRLQRTQPAAPPPPVGPLVRLLRRDDGAFPADGALFAAPDTAFARFAAIVPADARAQFDTLQVLLQRLQQVAGTGSADTVAVALARVAAMATAVRREFECRDIAGVAACDGALGDLALTLNMLRERATRAMLGAAGLVIDGVAARELVAAGDTVDVTITLRNGGALPIRIGGVMPFHPQGTTGGDVPRASVLPPDSVRHVSATLFVRQPTYHWWQINGLVAGTLLQVVRADSRSPLRSQLIQGEDAISRASVQATVTLGGAEVPVTVGPLVARSATALRGDVRHPLIGVPEASLLLERGAEYERAGLPVNRLFRVFVSSYRSAGDTLQVSIDLPKGLQTDSATRVVALPPFGSRNLFFPLRGALSAGEHEIAVRARSLRAVPAEAIGGGQNAALREYTLGTVINDYPHIPSQHFVRFAKDRLEAVPLRLPPRLRVGYVRGTEDLRVPLGQLRVSAVQIDAGLLPVYDLGGITTLLVGYGALRGEASVTAVPALQAFLARGGTIVLLGGGAEISRLGLFPYPISVESAGGRAAADSSDVRVTDPRSPLLMWPNVISGRDFTTWLGDRTCGRLTMADGRYLAPLRVLDGTGPASTPAIVATRVGKGTLIHTTLCLAGQLDAAKPGGARLLANLLSAGLQQP